MGPQEVSVGICTGFLLIALGVTPGLFWGLTDGIRNYLELISSGSPAGPPRHHEVDARTTPTFLAGLGATLMVVTVLIYFSN